jgi:hypothetical protein
MLEHTGLSETPCGNELEEDGDATFDLTDEQ